MEEEHHIVDGVYIRYNGRTIAFIRVFVSDKDNSSIKVIHRGIKEAIKHFIDEGFDVIRGTGDDYKGEDEGLNMNVIVENMISPAKGTTVSIQSSTINELQIFNRIHDALIQHMVLKGFKRL